MNRLKAITVKDNIDSAEFTAYCNKFKAERSIVDCPQLGMKVIWFENWDLELLKFLPDIIQNFVAYSDNGKEEITVINNDYINYSKLYLKRKGIYDEQDTTIH